MTAALSPRDPAALSSPARRVSRVFTRHRRFGLFATLTAPVAWLLIVYIGSLLFLVVTAFFTLNPATQKPTTELTTENIDTAFTTPAYRSVVWTSVQVAVLVTLLCLVIALPYAFYVAKIA